MHVRATELRGIKNEIKVIRHEEYLNPAEPVISSATGRE